MRPWVRSALAPPLWSRRLPAGLLAIAVIVTLDIAVGSRVALASALAVIALAVGFLGERGDTIVVASCCVAAAALSGLWGEWDAAWTVTLVVVAASSVSAVFVSLLRAAAITTRRQLDLLRDLAGLTGGSRSVVELSEALLDLLVPAYADVATLDLSVQDLDRRVGARVAGPGAAVTERWLRGRPPVDPSLPGTQQVIATGRPAFVEEVRDEMLRELATDEADLALLRGLGVRSAITLPLATRGAPFGALSLIIGSSGRRYAPADLEFARLVQGRIAIVLDNTGLSRAAARSEAIMSAALDTLEEAVTMNGPDGSTVYANQAAVRLLGATSAEEVVNGQPGAISARYGIYDEAGRPYDYRDLPAFRALAGEEHPEAKLVRNVVLATGEERWLLNKVSVLRDADGGVDRIVNVIEDVTEVKNAEVRQRILGEATRALSAAPDREPGLAGVAAAVVPHLAEWCAVDVDGPAAGAGREPAAGDERLVVGLRAGGAELGTLTLGRARSFSDEDCTLAEELGRRAAIAVLDARLSEERAEITRELQEGLRPPELPAVPGLRTATLYRPAGELNDVGGDFYDAFATGAGWTVCIGDVAGQGARAATLTGLMRYTLRSVAQHTGGQGAAIAAVNRALAEQPELALGTLAVVRLHRGTGGELVLGSLSAGHPLPLLIRDGAVRELGAPGPIAGVFEDAEWPMTDTPLRRGDTIVLYTDGVLDTVGDDGRYGDERLLALLAGAPADPAAVVARIDTALAAFQAGPQRDDTAIVAITVDDVHAVP
jgi:serine phosphatase RsbU (regulator of sigma subunit)/PAS domain-containing protein